MVGIGVAGGTMMLLLLSYPFFLVLAAINEVLRHTLQFGDWIAAKLWLFMPLSFLFTFIVLAVAGIQLNTPVSA